MDGLCIDGHMGAAVVMYRRRVEKQVVRLYLGTQSEYTVFKAELVGAAMGEKLIQFEKGAAFLVGIDSQAAICTT